MKILQIIMIPFTGVGLHNGYRGDEWFKERIRLFKEFTAPSLFQQTNQNFLIWLTFRPEEVDNPLIDDLINFLDEKKANYIITFDGLMYIDDKFCGGIKNKLLNIARIIRNGIYKKDWAGFKEVLKDKNKTLENRLENALIIIKQAISKLNPEWIYLTRIDSDDMFHKNVFQSIQQIAPFKGALIFKKGLVYNEITKELAEWNPNTNPPFHTIIFPAEDFLNAQKHLDYYKGFKSHEDIPRIYDYKFLKDYGYCVLVHNKDNHISTCWNHPFKGKLIEENKELILKDFGIIN